MLSIWTLFWFSIKQSTVFINEILSKLYVSTLFKGSLESLCQPKTNIAGKQLKSTTRYFVQSAGESLELRLV